MWHPEHFCCAGDCGESLAGKGYTVKDGQAFCEEDYERAATLDLMKQATRRRGTTVSKKEFHCHACKGAIAKNFVMVSNTEKEINDTSSMSHIF